MSTPTTTPAVEEPVKIEVLELRGDILVLGTRTIKTAGTYLPENVTRWARSISGRWTKEDGRWLGPVEEGTYGIPGVMFEGVIR